MSRGARHVALLTLLTLPLGCSDGTPAFCGPLSEAADLDAVSEALDAGDLDAAQAEAAALQDLAAGAPDEIRSDLIALADSVADIVDLVVADTPEPGEADDRPGRQASEVERRRDDVNSRFADLDRRSTVVTTWAARECGLDLT